ncbi:MAG: formylglycine-generating enzyme family protein [Gemmatimonadota bacterium]|nr:formylglycine-generating enzyme family protein [Gemmatimonadota bacterium]
MPVGTLIIAAVAAAKLFAGVHPANAQDRLGSVVCLGSEYETLAGGAADSSLAVRKGTEIAARLGVDLGTLDEAERELRAELGLDMQTRCVRSGPGHTHVVIVSYMGFVSQESVSAAEGLVLQNYAVGYGAGWEEAEEQATTLNERFTAGNDGSGYEIVVRETWGANEVTESIPNPPVESGLLPGAVFRDCAVCPEMIVVPAGSFTMGSPNTEEGRYDDEGPQHLVAIDAPFAVGIHEVTFEEWDACTSGGGCLGYRPDDRGLGRGRIPVIEVNWADAQAYLRWLSRKTGKRYRLLTEAEWEYVARAGTRTARYWGDNDSWQCRYANGFDQALARTDHGRAMMDLARVNAVDRPNPASCFDGAAFLAPAGSFPANGFGLHDVLGNVWEWTEDCWNGGYSGAPSDGCAWTSGDCVHRVLRGGAWNALVWNLRSAFRLKLPGGNRSNDVGFRVARNVN